MLWSGRAQCQTKTGSPNGRDPSRVSASCIFLLPLSPRRCWYSYGKRQQAVVPIPYSEFQQLLENGKIKEVVVSDDALRGELTEPIDGKTRFVTNRVEPDLAQSLQAHGVEYSKEKQSTLLRVLASWLLPLLLLLGFWLFLSRRMAGMGGPGAGLMSVGKSKAKVYMETDTRVTFSDVAGVDEAKQELQEVVAFLKDPESYGRLGARMPRGIAAGRRTRHGQNALGPSRSRRVASAFLFHQRIGVCGDVRGCRRGTRSRSVRPGPSTSAMHHLHR